MNDTELVKWNKGAEKRITRSVDALMEILSIDEDGNVKTTQGFKLDICLKILTESLTLESIPDPETKRHVLYRAVFNRLKLYELQDIHMLRRAVAAEIRTRLSRPTQEYLVLLPLHAPEKHFSDKPSLLLLDVELQFKDWEYVRNHLDFDSYVKDTRRRLTNPRFNITDRFTPILVSTEGKDDGDAFENAVLPFDMLRWLINLLYGFGRVRRQFGGYPRPLGPVLPPPTFGIFAKGGEYRQLYFSLEKYEKYKDNNIDGRVFPDVEELASRLSGPTGETRTLTMLIEAIQKYGEAQDTNQWRLAFLLLWQILELITLQSQANLKMKTVRTRINCLLGQAPLTKDLLYVLYETRNSLVHSGVFPEVQGLREVSLLKYVVERSINKLFSLLDVCPTRASLQRYYEHISANSAELSDRQQIIQHILESRS